MAEKMMLRPAEAAEALGVSRSKAYELIAAGDIPSVRIGGCVRIPVDALREWIDHELGSARNTSRASARPYARTCHDDDASARGRDHRHAADDRSAARPDVPGRMASPSG